MWSPSFEKMERERERERDVIPIVQKSTINRKDSDVSPFKEFMMDFQVHPCPEINLLYVKIPFTLYTDIEHVFKEKEEEQAFFVIP